jgi:hypothetical protein
MSDGFRAEPVKDLMPRSRKRSRKVAPAVSVAQSLNSGKKKNSNDAAKVPAHVPVCVLQRIRELLDMAPEDLTMAKLTAKPSANNRDDMPNV